MTATHQPGQFLLVYSAVDGYPTALFFGQMQTLPGFLAGTGTGDVQVQPRVLKAGEGLEQPVNPLGQTQLSGIQQADWWRLCLYAGDKELFIISTTNDIYALSGDPVDFPNLFCLIVTEG